MEEAAAFIRARLGSEAPRSGTPGR
jgi:hypothetical protein